MQAFMRGPVRCHAWVLMWRTNSLSCDCQTGLPVIAPLGHVIHWWFMKLGYGFLSILACPVQIYGLDIPAVGGQIPANKRFK